MIRDKLRISYKSSFNLFTIMGIEHNILSINNVGSF